MAGAKIVVIGGGSYLWSPRMMQDLVLEEGLEGSTITLMDIASEPLQLMLKLGEKIIRRAKTDSKIEGTTNRREALEGADYVILTISTGGFETMKHDLDIPLKYGVYQPVGDTTGPGGISRALRNIPVVVDIAKDMEDLCPNAWLINYTNPMTTLCRAVNRTTKIRTIGLCHELFGTLHWLQEALHVENESDIHVKIAGINHLVWILDLRIKGEDGFPLLKRYMESRGDSILDRGRVAVNLELFKVFGCLPVAAARHTSEFFPYFLTEETQAGKKFGIKLTTIADRVRRAAKERENAEKMVRGERPLRLVKSEETASRIISALANRKDEVHVMNLPNRGQVANLPRDAVVETYGVVGARGACGMEVGDLPLGVLNTLYPHVVKYELTVEAALTGDRNLALQAMLTDPLIRNFESASKMLDELLEANAEYLPQFFGGEKSA